MDRKCTLRLRTGCMELNLLCARTLTPGKRRMHPHGRYPGQNKRTHALIIRTQFVFFRLLLLLLLLLGGLQQHGQKLRRAHFNCFYYPNVSIYSPQYCMATGWWRLETLLLLVSAGCGGPAIISFVGAFIQCNRVRFVSDFEKIHTIHSVCVRQGQAESVLFRICVCMCWAAAATCNVSVQVDWRCIDACSFVLHHGRWIQWWNTLGGWTF